MSQKGEGKGKRKKTFLIIVVALVIIVPVLCFVSLIEVPDTPDVPVGLEIEEEINLLYSEWNIGTNYQWTRVIEGADDSIIVTDSNVGLMAKATRSFNNIDIGKLKMQISAQSTSRNYFAMRFRSDSTTLFMLERKVTVLTFVVSGNSPIIIFSMDTTWRTIEVFFDLSDGSNGEVSIDLDGVTVVDAFVFNPNEMKINNIYMHTSTSIYKSRTDIKFEYLYNYKIV